VNNFIIVPLDAEHLDTDPIIFVRYCIAKAFSKGKCALQLLAKISASEPNIVTI
jgi:hypothetical protein